MSLRRCFYCTLGCVLQKVCLRVEVNNHKTLTYSPDLVLQYLTWVEQVVGSCGLWHLLPEFTELQLRCYCHNTTCWIRKHHIEEIFWKNSETVSPNLLNLFTLRTFGQENSFLDNSKMTPKKACFVILTSYMIHAALTFNGATVH